MKAIAIISKNRGIGYGGNLLFALPPDLAHFKKLTMGKPVIFGRKTLATFPGGKPLEGRRNIMLTGSEAPGIPGVEICHGLEQLAALLLRDGLWEESCVIGGGTIFRQLVNSCAQCVLTQVETAAPADTFFPELPEEAGWSLARRDGPFHYEGLAFSYNYYLNACPVPLEAAPEQG